MVATLDIGTKLDEVFGVLYRVIPGYTLIYRSIPFGSGICAKIPEEELGTVLCYWRDQISDILRSNILINCLIAASDIPVNSLKHLCQRPWLPSYNLQTSLERAQIVVMVTFLLLRTGTMISALLWKHRGSVSPKYSMPEQVSLEE